MNILDIIQSGSQKKLLQATCCRSDNMIFFKEAVSNISTNKVPRDNVNFTGYYPVKGWKNVKKGFKKTSCIKNWL